MKEYICDLKEASNIISRSKTIVVLTGAGMSTESGIPDFRSRAGLYNNVAPESKFTLNHFLHYPKEFYELVIKNLYFPNALPNKGHKILVEWERLKNILIITQNIDGLHKKAGSKNVIEYHGTLESATCIDCKSRYSFEEIINRREKTNEFYKCDNCKGLIKPDTVLFGESGPWFTNDNFSLIIKEIHKADCILILGTSLKVAPFATFPKYRFKETPMIIINKGETPYDHKENILVFNASIGVMLEKINPTIL